MAYKDRSDINHPFIDRHHVNHCLPGRISEILYIGNIEADNKCVDKLLFFQLTA